MPSTTKEKDKKLYIDKNVLLSEIYRMEDELYPDAHDEYDGFVRNALDRLVSFIETNCI